MIRSRTRLGALLLAVPLALLACSDDDGTSPGVPSSLVAVAGDDATAQVGNEVELTVQVNDENSNAMPGVEVSWSVVEGEGSIDGSRSTTNEQGRASTTLSLGTTAGVQMVRASVEGVSSATFRVLARPGAMAGIQISPDSVRFQANQEEEQLEVSGADEYGNALNVNANEASWASLDEEVAQVDESGRVVSVGTGETQVTATVGEYADTIDVVVRPPEPLARVIITAEEDTILVEGEVQLSAAGIDEADDPYVLGKIEWSSSDESTATVDQDGYVTSHAGGTTTITAESEEIEGVFELVVRGRIHNSNITGDTTWLKRDSPHWVTSSITVGARSSNPTLTIEPGALVEFASETGLQFNGGSTLIAEGTAEDTIVFTGVEKTAGFWKGIWLYDTRETGNVLDHVVIEYGGGGTFHSSNKPANLVFGRSSYNGRSTVKNTTLRHSAGYGVHVHSSSEMKDAEGNTFTQNASGAASVYASGIDQLDDGSTYTGNLSGNDFVLVTGNTVEKKATWQAIDVPYRMDGKTTVQSELTIDENADFEFTHESELMFSGNEAVIRAVGTDTAPITFTGVEAQRGFWKGIYFYNATSPNNVMEYVTVSHGGNEAFHSSVKPANIVVGRDHYSSRLRLKNSTLTDSDGYGLHLHGNSRMDGSEANTYEDNRSGAVQLYTTGIEYMDSASTYTGNDEDFVDVKGNDADGIGAAWQALDVPYRMSGRSKVEGGLTIDPGANFAFEHKAALEFHGGGKIDLVGTAQDSITFTSTDSEENRGYWKGIYLYDATNPNNKMEYVIIEYGGYEAFHSSSTEKANLTVGRSHYRSDLELRNSTLRYSGGYGIHIHSGSDINADVCTANTITDNDGGQCKNDS